MLYFKNIKTKFNKICNWILSGNKRYLKMISVSSLFCIAFGMFVTLMKNIPVLFSIAFQENKALIEGVQFVSIKMVQTAWMSAYCNFIMFLISILLILGCISIAVNIFIIKFKEKKGVTPKNYMLSIFYTVEDRFL